MGWPAALRVHQSAGTLVSGARADNESSRGAPSAVIVDRIINDEFTRLSRAEGKTLSRRALRFLAM